jgi:hypothetical protein
MAIINNDKTVLHLFSNAILLNPYLFSSLIKAFLGEIIKLQFLD